MAAAGREQDYDVDGDDDEEEVAAAAVAVVVAEEGGGGGGGRRRRRWWWRGARVEGETMTTKRAPQRGF